MHTIASGCLNFDLGPVIGGPPQSSQFLCFEIQGPVTQRLRPTWQPTPFTIHPLDLG